MTPLTRANTKTKAQAALEFILLLGFMFFVFVAFFGVLQGKLSDAFEQQTKQALADELQITQSDITTGAVMEDGYSHVFSLPLTIHGKKYLSLQKERELQFAYAEEPFYESSFILPANVQILGLPQGEPLCMRKKEGVLVVMRC